MHLFPKARLLGRRPDQKASLTNQSLIKFIYAPNFLKEDVLLSWRLRVQEAQRES